MNMKEFSDLIILIAEDDETFLLFLVRFLIACGCQEKNISVVGNGQLALARLLAGPLPDLLITDMQMGGGDLDGDVLIKNIKSHPQLNTLPVGMYSNRTEEFDPTLHQLLRKHHIAFQDKMLFRREEMRPFLLRILDR